MKPNTRGLVVAVAVLFGCEEAPVPCAPWPTQDVPSGTYSELSVSGGTSMGGGVGFRAEGGGWILRGQFGGEPTQEIDLVADLVGTGTQNIEEADLTAVIGGDVAKKIHVLTEGERRLDLTDEGSLVTGTFTYVARNVAPEYGPGAHGGPGLTQVCGRFRVPAGAANQPWRCERTSAGVVSSCGFDGD